MKGGGYGIVVDIVLGMLGAIVGGWIFSALDRPDGTERWTRWIVRNLYNDMPDGLPGNDDSGTLSAWLAFAPATSC